MAEIKIKHVTNKCRYCGNKMDPVFDSLNGTFCFRCCTCGSRSPVCYFSPEFINNSSLAECIDSRLIGIDIDFEFEEKDESEE